MRLSLACAVLCSPSYFYRPISAAASLRIAEGSPHASLWRRLYEKMPAPWKTDRAILVEEVSDAEMEGLVARSGEANRADDDSVVDGCFIDGGENEGDPARITLRETLEGEEAGLVFTHEYGHFVWDSLLTNSQRTRYQRLWKTQKRAGHLVTEYAGDSEEEGFAEAFAYYLRKPETLRHSDEASWQFLHGLLTAKEARARGNERSRNS